MKTKKLIGYVTEDGHIKADCPVCEASEHMDYLKEYGRCETCLIEEQTEWSEQLEIVLHELNNNTQSSNDELINILLEKSYFKRSELTLLVEAERMNFIGTLYHFLSTEKELEIIEKYLPRFRGKGNKIKIDDEENLIVTVAYLDSKNVNKCTLYELWDKDGTLADSLTSKERRMNQAFKLTDSSGYKHIIFIEVEDC